MRGGFFDFNNKVGLGHKIGRNLGGNLLSDNDYGVIKQLQYKKLKTSINIMKPMAGLAYGQSSKLVYLYLQTFPTDDINTPYII